MINVSTLFHFFWVFFHISVPRTFATEKFINHYLSILSMKILNFWTVALMALSFSTTFVSCSDDDEKSITLSFAQSKVTSYQPSGTVDVKLTVSDNGRGFEQQTGKTGIGLTIIKERVENLRGTLTLNSAPEKGTELIVEIDLENLEK